MDFVREDLGSIEVLLPYKDGGHELEHPGMEMPTICLTEGFSQHDDQIPLWLLKVCPQHICGF